MTTTTELARFPAEAPRETGGPWYRRRGALVALGALVVLAVAVITDLPVPTSRTSDLSAAKTVINQINVDVHSCSWAVREAYSVYAAEAGGTLTDAQRAQAPGLLAQDRAACSFGTEGAMMYDLATIDIPGGASGRTLATVVNVSSIWASGDAYGSIGAIQTLLDQPGDAAARRTLLRYQGALASDRGAAFAAVASDSGMLGADLPALQLPAVNLSGTGLVKL